MGTAGRRWARTLTGSMYWAGSRWVNGEAGWTCHGVRFASRGRGRAAWHTTGQEEGGEHRWGQSMRGVAWVHAIGGVAVAHDGVGDLRWMAGGQTERAGTQCGWVRGLDSMYLECGCVEGSQDASHSRWTAAWLTMSKSRHQVFLFRLTAEYFFYRSTLVSYYMTYAGGLGGTCGQHCAKKTAALPTSASLSPPSPQPLSLSSAFLSMPRSAFAALRLLHTHAHPCPAL